MLKLSQSYTESVLAQVSRNQFDVNLAKDYF